MSFSIKPAPVSAQLGAGIGKGLAAQVPQEINRYRLSKGLEGLGQMGNLSPLEQVSKLYQIPGITPDMVATLAPLLQKAQIARESREKRIGGLDQTMQSGMTGNLQPGMTGDLTSALVDQKKATQPPASTQAIDRRASPNYLLPSTPEELNKKALQLQNQFPYRFGDNYEAALAEAQRLDSERLAIDQAYQSRSDLVEQEFQKQLEQKIQKGGTETYADVLGDLQSRFQKEAIDMVDRGLASPQEAARQVSKKALDFAKSRQQLKNIGMQWFLSTTPAKVRDAYSVIRKEYDKVGELESFEKDLQTFEGLSPYYSSSLAYPTEGNKDIENIIKSSQPVPSFAYATGIKGKEDISQLSEKIGSKIKPDDSILSIGLALKDKGFNEEDFIKEINKLYNENKIQLNERQVRELQNTSTSTPNLDDLWILGWMRKK